MVKLLDMMIPYDDDDCKVIGAGVLPYAVHQQRTLFLLGQEDNDGRFGVFGGRLKANGCVEDTAITEFEEETLGVVVPTFYIADAIKGRQYTMRYSGAAGTNRFFVTYLIRVPFNPDIDKAFRAARAALSGGVSPPFLQGCIDESGRPRPDFLEKRSLEWFDAHAIFDAALKARWNHPVTAIRGSPMFRRPFLSGLSGLLQYFNMPALVNDLVWCHAADRLRGGECHDSGEQILSGNEENRNDDQC